MYRSLLLFAASASILLAAGEGFAQNRTTGGASTGSAFGGATSQFGSSSFGASSFGSSSLGQSSLGTGTSSIGSTGVSGAGSTNQAFVGRSAADIESFFGGVAQAFDSAQRGERASSNRSSSGSSSGRRPEVRVTLSASPELRASVAQRTTSSVAPVSNVARLLARKGLDGVRLDAAGGTVTLSGTVASTSERLVAEKLAAIEPGVRRVENLLLVASAPAEIVPAVRP